MLSYSAPNLVSSLKCAGHRLHFGFTIFLFAPSPARLISGAPGFPSVPECATESYLRSHSILILHLVLLIHSIPFLVLLAWSLFLIWLSLEIP